MALRGSTLFAAYVYYVIAPVASGAVTSIKERRIPEVAGSIRAGRINPFDLELRAKDSSG